MANTVMRQLERALSDTYPELVCEIREGYFDWNARTGREIQHWHEELRNINSFLNWLMIDRFNQLSARRKAGSLKTSVVRARNSLGSLNNATHVDCWIDNLIDRYFSTYVDLVE